MSTTAGSTLAESLLPSGASAEKAKPDRDLESENDQAVSAYHSSSDGETSSVLTQRRSLSEKPTKLRLSEGAGIGSQHSPCLRAIMVKRLATLDVSVASEANSYPK